MDLYMDRWMNDAQLCDKTNMAECQLQNLVAGCMDIAV